MTELFVVPPPPGSMTDLLTEEYLSSLIVPPPPDFDRDKRGKCASGHSDVDSDYHSVGETSPTEKRALDRYRSSPVGAVASSSKEGQGPSTAYIRTTLPEHEITVSRRTRDSAPACHRSHSSDRPRHQHGRGDPEPPRPQPRGNRMYSSLQRPSTAAARRRRGSHEGILKRQPPISLDVHGAIDNFIRSEQRYTSDIESLINLHIDPMQYSGCIHMDVINNLKSSLHRLIHFHKQLCSQFESSFSRLHSETSGSGGGQADYYSVVDFLCETLMESRSGFKTYTHFCSCRAQLIRNIGQLDSEEVVRWEKYLRECNPSQEKNTSLQAGLDMPLQRVSDYSTMVHQIKVRGCVDNGSLLGEKLGRTCKMLEGVASAVHNRVTMLEEFSTLYKSNKHLEVLIGPIEELLHCEGVMEPKTKDLESFVPESDPNMLLLVFKKGAAVVQKLRLKKKHSFNRFLSATPSLREEQQYNLKKFYPVSSLQITDLPRKLYFEIKDTVTQNSNILACRTLDAKSELLRSIANMIEDYNKFLSCSLQIKDTL